MKSIVVYYSKSGNTQKIAQAVATGMGALAKKIEEVKPGELAAYDVMAFGSPVHNGAPDKVVSDFISQLPDLKGKKAAFFCTKSLSGDKSATASVQKTLEAKGAVFLGGFCAIGWSRFFANFGPRIIHRGHPNVKELSAAEAFGRGLMAKKS